MLKLRKPRFYKEPKKCAIEKNYADDYVFWEVHCLGFYKRFNNELDAWKWIADKLDESLEDFD